MRDKDVIIKRRIAQSPLERRRNTLCLLTVMCCFFSVAAVRPAGVKNTVMNMSQQTMISSEEIEAGKRLYEQRCLYCHGPEGKGDGVAAIYLDPAPRDFTLGQFKIRSTAFRQLPTDNDLFEIITEGMPGTSMPGWDIYSEDERWQLVQYLKTFYPGFASKGALQSIALGGEIRATDESVAIGKDLFRKMKCFLCHGDDGRADGPITERLRYEWGRPFQARDLTKGYLFRGGNEMRDIFRTISTGLNGTPMGSYEDFTTDEDRWHLTHYVKSIATEKEIESEVVLKSKLLQGEIPLDPNDAIWEKMKPFKIPLTGQIIKRPSLWTPSIESVKIRSLYNGQEIAFLLEWNDITNKQDKVFQDSIALQFPVIIPESAEKPYFFMGARGRRVNLWTWKAGFPAGEGEVAHEEEYAQEINAEGPESVTVQPPDNQDVKVIGVWEKGRWRVVMKRSLRTDEENIDVQFMEEAFIPIALNVWDGSNGDIGLKKTISAWNYMRLETPASLSLYVYVLIAILFGLNLEMWVIPKLRKFAIAYNGEESESSPDTE